jgi:MFS family permease
MCPSCRPRFSDTVGAVLTTYRAAFAIPGAWQFSVSALVARLPIAMIGLGIVLLISGQTGSYAMAGLLAAIFQIAAAGGALVTSRWMDRLGQHALLVWLALVHAAGLLAFVTSVQAGLPVAVQALTAALAGLTQPAIGSMVRARWAYVADGPVRLRSAFAIESIVDEMLFTVGPLLTAYLAFQVALPLPLVVAAALTVAGSVALAVQRRTEPPATRSTEPTDRPRGRSAIAQPGMLIMVAAAMGIGGVFGTYEVTVVAFTEQSGDSGASGLILGLWALGSMVGGLVFGARQWRVDLPSQVVVLSGVLALALTVAPLVRTVPQLAVTTLIAGLVVAPVLIAVFSLTERLVPAEQLTEGLTWANSGLALGFSFGTAINGVVIDAEGTTVAFILPALCASMACLAALLGRGVLRGASAHRSSGALGIARNAEPVPGPAPGAVDDDPEHTTLPGATQ